MSELGPLHLDEEPEEDEWLLEKAMVVIACKGAVSWDRYDELTFEEQGALINALNKLNGRG